MKAYRVIYINLKSDISAANILTDNQVCASSKDIETIIAEKDKEFIVDSQWCKIKTVNEIPLSEIMVKDLSVSDLLKLLENTR